MKLITEQGLADEAPARWAEQYRQRPDPWQAEITRKLSLLEPPISPRLIDATIGNKSWTDPGSCDECGERPGALMQMGQPPDYESSTANLCLSCLESAVAKLKVLKETV